MYVQYNIYICSLDISKPFEFLWFPFFFRIASLETYSTEGCHGRTGRTCPWKLCNSSRTAVGDLGCWKVYSSRWEVASQDFFARSLRCNQTLCEKKPVPKHNTIWSVCLHFQPFWLVLSHISEATLHETNPWLGVTPRVPSLPTPRELIKLPLLTWYP